MALTDIPASEIASWLASMDGSPSLMDTLVKQPIYRAPGKSSMAFDWAEARRKAVTSLQGEAATTIIIDEWDSPYLSTPDLPVFTYRDDRWPAATVEVFARKLDKRDPRNPNPAAGSQEVFVVVASGRESAPSQLAMAKMRAEQTHLRLVAALSAEADRLAAEEEAEQIVLMGRARF
jgi:hypothetical protein